MSDSPHSLKFQFDIQGGNLKPGDIVPSSCPPTDTTLDGRSVVYSPGGFPLHFTIELVYAKDISYPLSSSQDPHWFHAHSFLLRVHLEQPSDIPCLPPLHIQPMPIAVPGTQPNLSLYNPVSLARCLVGPQQPANWGLRWEGSLELDSTWSGEFRFQLLDEPLHLIENLPPHSEADWSCLPQDMITAVLRELALADRVSARLVCREWKLILDTDSRAWNNVHHLQSISKYEYREELYGYHDGRLNQVRHIDHKLYKALDFLTSRKAPIHTLELVHNRRPVFDELKREDIEPLSSRLSQHKIQLKAFALQGCLANASAEHVLKLLISQPSLERVYLVYHEKVPLPPLLEALPRLRILSIHWMNPDRLQAFQTHLPQLSRLDGLRVGALTANARIAVISNSLASHNSDLRRVMSVKPPGDEPAVVWGSANLSPAEAAFLLIPVHSGTKSIPFQTTDVLNHHL